MISPKQAVHSFHRDVQAIRALRILSLAIVIIVLICGAALGMGALAAMFSIVIAGAWLLLQRRSNRLSEQSHNAADFLEAGEFSEAEACLEQLLETRCVLPRLKAAAMRQLAQARAAQKLWQDCVTICLAIVGHESPSTPAARGARLLLLEAYLRTGNLAAAYEVLGWFYTQRLELRVSLRLLWLQTEYESRVGAHQHALNAISRKIPLIELMSAGMSGRTHAWLARSAAMAGNATLCRWLAGRAALLAGVETLVSEHPELQGALTSRSSAAIE